jgi:hypothetical protein
MAEMDNFIQYSKLILPKNCTNIPKNWLKFEILGLMKYPLREGKFALIDKNDDELCICRFRKEYEKTMKLSGYISNVQDINNSHKIFGDIKYLGKTDVKQHEKLSTQDEVSQFSISTTDKVQDKYIHKAANRVGDVEKDQQERNRR